MKAARYPLIVYILTGCFLIGVLALFCLAAADSFKRATIPNIKTEAEVTDIGQITRRTKRHGRWMTTSTYTVEYTYRDINGEEHNVSPAFTTGFVPYKVGDKVTLWYNPEYPSVWRTTFVMVMNVSTLIILAIFGLVFTRLLYSTKFISSN